MFVRLFSHSIVSWSLLLWLGWAMIIKHSCESSELWEFFYLVSDFRKQQLVKFLSQHLKMAINTTRLPLITMHNNEFPCSELHIHIQKPKLITCFRYQSHHYIQFEMLVKFHIGNWFQLMNKWIMINATFIYMRKRTIVWWNWTFQQFLLAILMISPNLKVFNSKFSLWLPSFKIRSIRIKLTWRFAFLFMFYFWWRIIRVICG